MTDVEAAEKVLAQLQDQRDRATLHAAEIAGQRKACGYAAFVDGSEAAKGKLTAVSFRARKCPFTRSEISLAAAQQVGGSF
jgi:hypothetical protein